MINRRSILTIAGGALAAAPMATQAAAAGRDTGLLSAAAFGVVPDAKGDQSARLQKALDAAMRQGRPLFIAAGRYRAGGLSIASPAAIAGVPGLTRLEQAGRDPVLRIDGAGECFIEGIGFAGGGQGGGGGDGLVEARGVARLVMRDCRFGEAQRSGLVLERCGGRIEACRFEALRHAAIFANGSTGLSVVGNDIADIGDNGILIWQPAPGEDGAMVSGNRITNIRAESGGTGQNGNGINVYRAGNVQVTDNRISDCAFSGVRNNAGANCRIAGNSISRTGEVAIFCEFGFQGAVVSDNLIEDVSFGISITNFNEDGRLAVVSGNLVRNVYGAGSLPDTRGVGIAVEADTLVTGNVVEGAAAIGIGVGWGRFLRDVSVTGNLVRDCDTGIAVSVVQDAGRAAVSGNTISGALLGAIVGMDHRTPQTRDLSRPGEPVPRNLTVAGNVVF